MLVLVNVLIALFGLAVPAYLIWGGVGLIQPRWMPPFVPKQRSVGFGISLATAFACFATTIALSMWSKTIEIDLAQQVTEQKTVIYLQRLADAAQAAREARAEQVRAARATPEWQASEADRLAELARREETARRVEATRAQRLEASRQAGTNRSMCQGDQPSSRETQILSSIITAELYRPMSFSYSNTVVGPVMISGDSRRVKVIFYADNRQSTRTRGEAVFRLDISECWPYLTGISNSVVQR